MIIFTACKILHYMRCWKLVIETKNIREANQLRTNGGQVYVLEISVWIEQLEGRNSVR